MTLEQRLSEIVERYLERFVRKQAWRRGSLINDGRWLKYYGIEYAKMQEQIRVAFEQYLADVGMSK